MKKLLLPAVFALLSIQTSAQDIFALTGKAGNQIIFNDLRTLDLNNGTEGEILITAEKPLNIFSQTLQSNFSEDKTSVHNAQTPSMAALAFDTTSNSTFFVPMFSSNVYVMSNRTKKITLVENSAIKSIACNLESHLTRMATSKNGNVYAMSNSVSQLIEISSTNGVYAVKDLGAVKDSDNNAEISISQMLTGFGGDMVADAQNNLYVFSASNNIFKVNIKTLTAEFLGKISGLPANYTTNGSAVNSAGNVLIGNAQGESFYEVDMKTLEAKIVDGALKIPVYDLASSYFLNDSPALNANGHANGISIYPTKITEQVFNVKIDNDKLKGNFIVEVSDLMGNKTVKQNITVIRDHSEFQIKMNKMNAGVYIVNITDAKGVTIFSSKILVE